MVLERAAIEEDGGASDAVGGGVLIHHPATNADIVVLGALAQHGRGYGRPGQERERPDSGPRRRRARAPPRKPGPPRWEPCWRARHRTPAAGRRPSRGPGRLRPGSRASRRGVGRDRRDGRTCLAGRQEESQRGRRIVGRSIGDADLEVDRSRQDEPVVVVGVLADEVDPPGCSHDARRADGL